MCRSLSCCPLSLLLDNERWKQAEVPAEFQDLVNSIADGRITLPDRKPSGTAKQSEDRKHLMLLWVTSYGQHFQWSPLNGLPWQASQFLENFGHMPGAEYSVLNDSFKILYH